MTETEVIRTENMAEKEDILRSAVETKKGTGRDRETGNILVVMSAKESILIRVVRDIGDIRGVIGIAIRVVNACLGERGTILVRIVTPMSTPITDITPHTIHTVITPREAARNTTNNQFSFSIINSLSTFCGHNLYK